jgi:hypothetical protein
MDFKHAHLKIRMIHFIELERCSLEDLIKHRDGDVVNENIQGVSQDEINLWIGRKMGDWDLNKRTTYEYATVKMMNEHEWYSEAFLRQDFYAPTIAENNKDIPF